jgi:hypothetical protein
MGAYNSTAPNRDPGQYSNTNAEPSISFDHDAAPLDGSDGTDQRIVGM